MAIQSWNTCPTDCTTGTTYGAIEADQSCVLYDKLPSQINRVYLEPAGATDAFDYTVPAAPVSVSMSIDNTAGDNSKTIEIGGIGGIPAPEEVVTPYQDLQERVTLRRYILTHRVENMSASMYAFLQDVQCGDTNFTFRYSDVAGYVYGGAPGIVPSSVNVQFIHGEGREDVLHANMIFVFDAKGDPDRAPNPYA